MTTQRTHRNTNWVSAAWKAVGIGTLLACITPAFADAIVQASVYEYPNILTEGGGAPPSNWLYAASPQIGSPTSDTIDWSFACSTCIGYGISASGDAQVVNGALGVDSSIGVTGSPSGAHYLAVAQSYAEYTDSLTITGGTGNGVFAIRYEIDTGVTGSTGIGFNNSVAFLALGDALFDYYQLNNLAVTPGNEADFAFDGAFSGDTVTFYVPFTYGAAFTFHPVISTLARFDHDFDSTPYTSSLEFLDGATPTSALVFAGTPGSLGAQNASAAIDSTSGLVYGPNGVSLAAPEPGTWLMVTSAIGWLLFLSRRRLPPGQPDVA